MTLQILVVEPEQIVTQYLKNHSEYDVTQQSDLKLLSMDQSDVLIVESSVVEVNDLIQKKEYLKDYKYVFYVGQSTKQDVVLAKTYGIIPVETNEPQHVLSVVESIIVSERNNRVFAFIAADRKSGSTSVIHAVAENLVGATSKEVMVISLNNNLTEPIYTDATLDKLKTSIISQQVTFEEVLNISKYNGKYSFIGSNKNILDFSKYTAEQIEHFYTVLLEQDTHLILLDLGSDAQNPFLVVAFDSEHHTFLITKPTYNYQYAFNKKIEQIFEPYYRKKQKDFYTIINGINDYTQLNKQMYKIIAKIEQSEFGYEAENSNIPLHKLDNVFFEETFPIAKYIATLNGSYVPVDEEKEKQPLFNWFKTFKTKFKSKGSVEDGI